MLANIKHGQNFAVNLSVETFIVKLPAVSVLKNIL